MKELSIEEKARRYDVAIKRLEDIETGKCHKTFMFTEGLFDYIFPELKLSEDERIRESLLEYLHTLPNHYARSGVCVLEWIAWIEKQAQKPNANYLLSWSEIDEKMLQSLEGIVKDYWAKAEQEKNEIKIREASNVSYFLKTIQKSPLCWIKCSDGLPNRDGTYLVVTDGRHNDVYDMARYDSIEGWHKASEIIYWMPIPQLNNKSIIEQKSVWSKEDAKLWLHDDDIFLDAAKMIVGDLPRRSYGGVHKKEIVPWLLSLKERLKALKDRVQSQSQWRPSELQLECLYDAIKHYQSNGSRPVILMELLEELKKL